MKYCGIATPFKGVRVYARSAMGMPGSETALEELLCRVLGEQLTAGGVTKLADDIYCGGDTPDDAFNEWKKVLAALNRNGLKLSASKTKICPKTVSVLGWVWEDGTIRASPHKISTLAAVETPSTVGKLRSYIGSYKFLSRVMKAYSELLSPLEDMIAGRDKAEKIAWTESSLAAFRRSQENLDNAKILTLPRKGDQLQIITDASNTGVGAALYVLRDGKPKIAGFVSSRYKKHQSSWMPCEAEALSISVAVHHFSPYIVQSEMQTVLYTDSLPCVQAYNKLTSKGEFSSSARVATFLSRICQFGIQICHLKGSDNVYSDFASRNALECVDQKCQVCKYIARSIDCVVRKCTVQDVLDSVAPVPYNSRSGWFELQLSDDDLRRVCAHLKQGTKPSNKSTGIKDVKRYLQVAKVARDGLVVVPEYIKNVGRVERIVVPRSYIHGLLECLHIKLDHPSKAQLKKVFMRAFYGLNLDDALEMLSKSCHPCFALSDMPNNFLEQSTTTSPTVVGSNYSADVVTRSGQKILLVREYISSYTVAKLIWNEQASTLRTALLILTGELVPATGMTITVKVDPASACRCLCEDDELKRNGVKLELGHPKFKNKNPVAERGIRELHSELNRVAADSPNITEKLLMKAVQSLNCRLRSEGISAREIWTKRNQYNGEQIPVDDLLLIQAKEEEKRKSHSPSAKYKARGKTSTNLCSLKKGDVVYINSDRDKTHARDRYIVIEVGDTTCKVQKFTGCQLRARIYTVHRADIIKIKPWMFEEAADSDTEDEDTIEDEDRGRAKASYVGKDLSVRTDEEEEDKDEVEEDEEEEDKVEEENDKINDVSTGEVKEVEPVKTRSKRKTKVPKKLDDYVLYNP